MDEDVTDEQRLVLDASSRLIEKTFPLTRLRELVDETGAVDTDHRRKSAELGWFSFLVPEELGGGAVSDNGMVDATLVAYARGRVLQPDPYIGTNVVAYAVAHAGSDEQRHEVLPSLLAGERSAGWAVGGGAGAAPAAGVVRAERAADGYELHGRARFLQDVGPDGWILVTASVEGGSTQFLLAADTPGLTVAPVASLDLTRGFVDLVFDHVQLPMTAVLGAKGSAGDMVSRQLAIACVLTAAESVGAMDVELALTVAYAKDRIAFGRPIGSFQAIKHLLADTSLALEMSKAVVISAARNIGVGEYGCEAASIAKALVGDSGVDLAQSCFQVFGGIGYTWEHDQHLYLRRLTTDASIFGDPAWHRERLCQLSGLGEEVAR